MRSRSKATTATALPGSGGGGSAHLSDLAPEDKAKVAKLVDQLIGLGKENDDLKKKILNLEARETDNLSKLEANMTQSIFELTERIHQLEKHKSDSLQLLYLYQEKIARLLDENKANQRGLRDSHSKISYQLSQIQELEKLVLDQHSIIDSIQKIHSVSDQQEQLLMSTQQELQTVSRENEILQMKYRKLEDSSKYLANQIDELLPQLSSKKLKIEGLEKRIIELESRPQSEFVDKATQYEAVVSLVDQSIQCCLNEPTPQFLKSPHKGLMFSSEDETIPVGGTRRSRSEETVNTSEENTRVSKVKSVKLKVAERRSRTEKYPHQLKKTELPKSTSRQSEIFTPFRDVNRGISEYSRDNDIYNHNMEVYSASLFDLVERMEELDSFNSRI